MFVMGPGDVLDFVFDWSLWLPSGDTIASVVWTAASDLTVASSPAPAHTGTAATVWIDGGALDNVQCTLECQITTTQGRVAEATQDIAVHSIATPSSTRTYQVPAA